MTDRAMPSAGGSERRERTVGPAGIEDLLEGMGPSLDEGLVPARIFNDPEIHQLELERVFSRAWCFIGHESEIPSPGDYVPALHRPATPSSSSATRTGRSALLFDGCRHRGALVCRAEKGNASHFRCSYHGWTYKNTGELIGAPAFREAYGGTFERRSGGFSGAASWTACTASSSPRSTRMRPPGRIPGRHAAGTST